MIVPSRRSPESEPLLLENEREAVAELLQYLESKPRVLLTASVLITSRPHNDQFL
jgi:hypothetical protein